jgi:hypothetical protein
VLGKGAYFVAGGAPGGGPPGPPSPPGPPGGGPPPGGPPSGLHMIVSSGATEHVPFISSPRGLFAVQAAPSLRSLHASMSSCGGARPPGPPGGGGGAEAHADSHTAAMIATGVIRRAAGIVMSQSPMGVIADTTSESVRSFEGRRWHMGRRASELRICFGALCGRNHPGSCRGTSRCKNCLLRAPCTRRMPPWGADGESTEGWPDPSMTVHSVIRQSESALCRLPDCSRRPFLPQKHVQE